MPSRAPFVISIMRARPLPSDAPASPPPCPDRRNASASTSSTSADATARVPSFSLRRRMRMPLRVPSRRSRNTRNVAMPRPLSGAPSGLASTTHAWPFAFDANHLKPLRRHASPSGVAVVSSSARSEPPVRSVSDWMVWPAHSPDANLAITSSRMSAGANWRTRLTTMSPPVPSAHAIPISAWSSM